MTVAASAMAEKKDGRASIVAGGDTPLVLQAAEHDLDAVAASVAALVVFGSSTASSDEHIGEPSL